MFFALLIGIGADPTFTVTNRCPPAFVVENKCPAVKTAARTGYPVRGNWWTHPGEIHAHLKSGEHAGKWPAWWIDTLTVAEAESLHSDDHEGHVHASYIQKISANVVETISAYPKNIPSVCPPGGCPTAAPTYYQPRPLLRLFR